MIGFFLNFYQKLAALNMRNFVNFSMSSSFMSFPLFELKNCPFVLNSRMVEAFLNRKNIISMVQLITCHVEVSDET